MPLCMFARVDDVIYVEAQFNDAKLLHFIGSYKWSKHHKTMLRRMFSLNKINKN